MKSTLNAAKEANVTDDDERLGNINEIPSVDEIVRNATSETPNRNETRDMNNLTTVDKRNSTKFDNATKEKENQK